MKTTTKTLQLTAAVEMQAAAGDGKPPKVSMVAYTGGLMRLSAWGETVIDISGIKLPPQLPLLANHSTAMDSIIGHGTPRVQANKLLLDGVLVAGSPVVQRILDLAGAGLQLQASVGANPLEFSYIEAGKKITVNGRTITAPAGGMTLVAKSELFETSIVPIGADRNTTVTVKAKRAPLMETETEIETAPASEPAPEILAERERVAGIVKAAAKFPAIQAQAITEGWTPMRAELEVLRASRGTVPTPRSAHGFHAGADSLVVLKAAAALHLAPAIAEKAYGAQACEAAAGLRVRSLRDLYAACVHNETGSVPTGDTALIRAAHSTASLPNVLADVASKEALVQYNAAPSAWRSVCRVVPVRDFKTHHMVRLLLAGGFEQVAPGGELKHASATDQDFTVKADTYGKMFGLDRQAIINDDAGVFMDISRIIGRKGAQYVNKNFATTLLTNAGNFFHASNGNLLTGAGTALSVNSLIAALANMRNRKDSDGENLDIAGTVLLVPPSLEATALQVLNSQEVMRYVSSTVDNAPTANPVRNSLTLAVEPRLENSLYTGHSSTAWYVFSNPADGAVAMAFLNGQQNPTVEQQEASFNTLGIAFRGFIDVGCSLADPAAALKMAGA
jgi:hypothetical protein